MNPALLVRLRPLGPWRFGPSSGSRDRVDLYLHSDGLYSAVSRAMEQLGFLEEWLAATAKAATPEVALSSLYPFLGRTLFAVPPKHLWPPPPGGRVRWKGARLVPLSVVNSLTKEQQLQEERWAVDPISQCLLTTDRSPTPSGPFRVNTRSSAAVDRLAPGIVNVHSTSCLEFAEGAGLWCVVTFTSADARTRWARQIRSAFRLLADEGIGGGRSRGWGRSSEPEFSEGTLNDLLFPPSQKLKDLRPRPPKPPQAVVSGPETVEALKRPAAPVEAAASEKAPDNQEPPATQAAVRYDEPADPIEPDSGPRYDEPADPIDPDSGPHYDEPADPIDPDSGPHYDEPADPIDPDSGPHYDEPADPIDPDSGPEKRTAGAEPGSHPDAPPQAHPEAPLQAEQIPAESFSLNDPPDPIQPDSKPDFEAPPPEPEPDPNHEDEPPAGDPEPDQPPEREPGPDSLPEGDPSPDSPPQREPGEDAPAQERSALEWESDSTKPGKAYWLLSVFAPSESDAIDWARGNYALIERSGRTGSAAAFGQLKAPSRVVEEGSVLFASAPPSGTAIDVAPPGFAHPVYRAGLAVSVEVPWRSQP